MPTTDTDWSPETAAELLAPEGGFLWHSGGGIMLARVDFGNDRCVLVNPAKEIDGESDGWYVGYYPDEDADGSIHAVVADEDALLAVVLGFKEVASRA